MKPRELFFARASRFAFLACAALASIALAASCGTRYFSATVSGYVRDANGDQAGVNGAEIRVYLEDPEAGAAAGKAVAPVAKTATMTSGGNDGYWSRKIIWTSKDPTFADEGDSGTVWVEVLRKGYFPKIKAVSGILSDSTNVIPTIEIKAIVATELKGRVVNENGAGVNGVRVVLDLETTVDVEDDYAATTATVDGVVGVFTFEDVAWEDADSLPKEARAIADGVATAEARLYVDDTAYYSDVNARKAVEKPAVIKLESGKKLDLIPAPLNVRSANFALPILRGRVVDIIDGSGVNGVSVSVDIPSTAANPDATVTTATLGGSAGWFQFEGLAWTSPEPKHSAAGLFDDKTTALVYIDDTTRYSASDISGPIALTIVSGTVHDMTNVTGGVALKAGDARFLAPSLKGVVQYAGSATGVNGVDLSLEVAGTNTVLNATTSKVNNVDGVFVFNRINWVDVKPLKNPDGVAKGVDTQQVRVYVQDNDFSSQSDSTMPVIVELTDGVIADIASPIFEVKRRNFTSPKVEGFVKNASDTGLAGMSVVLDLLSTPNDASDYTATTDKDGKYLFNNVSWTDEQADSATADTERVEIRLNDAAFRTTTAMPIETITSDLAAGGPTWKLIAERVDRWTYQANLTVHCAARAGASDTADSAVAGVKVTIAHIDTRGGDLVTNATPLEDYTDANGDYTVAVTWSRAPSYAPADDASKSNNGDKLTVKIDLSSTSGYTFASAASYEILSWSNNNRYTPSWTKP